MYSLKAKKFLTTAVKVSKHKARLNKTEIKKKITQIKRLTSKKKVSKVTLKRELRLLEKHLVDVSSLEKKLKSKERRENTQVKNLKEQIKELKKQLSYDKDDSLKKKVNKLSHLVGGIAARSDIKKEAATQELIQKQKPSSQTSLQKIDQLQNKILALKQSGQVPPEKITQLEAKLSELERKLTFPASQESVKHKMLFGSGKLPLPPPPKIVKEVKN